MTMWTNLTKVAFANAEPSDDRGAVEARGDQEGCAFLGGVGGPERRHDVAASQQRLDTTTVSLIHAVHTGPSEPKPR
jgi:hypothetical protein